MSVSRRIAGAALGAAMLCNVGCYTYQPLFDARPQPGQQVSLDLTDAGRASLGDQLGAGVLQVQGTLQEVRNDQYVIGVSRVVTISGGAANWGGERVRIPIGDVSRSGIRTLSPARTALLVGTVVVGIGVFVATRSLIGSGTTASIDTTRPPPAGTTRIPR